MVFKKKKKINKVETADYDYPEEEQEEEDDEQEEEEVEYPKRQSRTPIKKSKSSERFDLVHQPELIGIRDNDSGEVTRFALEQEIVDIKNKLDLIIKGSGF